MKLHSANSLIIVQLRSKRNSAGKIVIEIVDSTHTAMTGIVWASIHIFVLQQFFAYFMVKISSILTLVYCY